MKTYIIRYEMQDDGWWYGRIKGVAGAHSQGRTIEQTRERTIEALSALLDRDVSGAFFEDEVRLPTAAQKALSSARTAEAKAAALVKRAEKARVRAVRMLASSGLSSRDVGRLLGVSRQRAHQIGRRANV